jgi:lipopolysaccharide heptosyltransferase II
MPRAERIRRLLVVRNDRIGDLVLTLPTIEAARRAFPNAHLAVLVTPYTAPLVEGRNDVDEVIVDKPDEGVRDLAARLRRRRFDAALVVNTNTRNALAALLAGIPLRVCWSGKPAGWLLGNRHVRLHRSHPPVHEAHFALAFLRRLEPEAHWNDIFPRLEVDADVRRHVAERIGAELGQEGPLFGVHPGNKNSAFNWPLEHYLRLAAELSRHGRVMITGGPDEAPLLERMRKQLDAQAVGPVGYYYDLSLSELTSALSLQDVLTVSSTGPMHLAAALGTAVVALFSSHRAQVPAKWAPLGRRVTILQAPLGEGETPELSANHGEQHMRRITVAQALEANLQCVEESSVLV